MVRERLMMLMIIVVLVVAVGVYVLLCVMVAWKHLPFPVLPRKSPNSKVKSVQDYVYMLCEVNS